MEDEKDIEIKRLKKELEEAQGQASRDFNSWQATVGYAYERIGKALNRIRKKRSTGEPARSDAEEIELLVKHFENSKQKELPKEGCLIQRTKGGGGYVGNAILWWAKDDRGYTTDPFNAKIWQTDEAIAYTKGREDEYLAYPLSIIRDNVSHCIDMQHIIQKDRRAELEKMK